MTGEEKRKIKTNVKVRTHQRWVEGGPSEEVIAYAKQHNIKLKEGHTLVRQHQRAMDLNAEEQSKQAYKEMAVSRNGEDDGDPHDELGKILYGTEEDSETAHSRRNMAKADNTFMSGLAWTTDKED